MEQFSWVNQKLVGLWKGHTTQGKLKPDRGNPLTKRSFQLLSRARNGEIVEAFAAFIIVVLILVVYLIVLYNRLVRLRNAKETAYGQVETQLQLRLDLIPALVETVKGYASHEKETLTKVIEARSLAVGAKSPKEIDQADFGLTAALGKLFALAESYPDLKANGVFINLQSELSKTEATLNFARRFYNESVNVFNTAIQSFPAILFAGLLRFQVSEVFQAQAEAKNAPKFTFGG